VQTTEPRLRRDAERNRQLILGAARELFAERGLGVTLNDVAHHAGVGVGTVYRRFPDKAQLIDALFEQRLEEIVHMLEEALDDPDPWHGLTGFLERVLDKQAKDRGLKEVLMGLAPGSSERITQSRSTLHPLAAELAGRAVRSGAVRPDSEPQDFGILQLMVGAVIDAGRDVAPDLWRRYLAIMLQGLRAQPAPADPLPAAAVTPGEMDAVLMAARKPARSAGRDVNETQ
jgi:AcrR family transcriptional regulator